MSLARSGYRCECLILSAILSEKYIVASVTCVAIWIFYFEKIRVFKAGLRYEYISME